MVDHRTHHLEEVGRHILVLAGEGLDLVGSALVAVVRLEEARRTLLVGLLGRVQDLVVHLAHQDRLAWAWAYRLGHLNQDQDPLVGAAVEEGRLAWERDLVDRQDPLEVEVLRLHQ